MNPTPQPIAAEDLDHIEADAHQRMVARAAELWKDWPVNPEDLRELEPVGEAQVLSLVAEVRACWVLLAQVVDLLSNVDQEEALAHLRRAGWDHARATEVMRDPRTLPGMG